MGRIVLIQFDAGNHKLHSTRQRKAELMMVMICVGVSLRTVAMITAHPGVRREGLSAV